MPPAAMHPLDTPCVEAYGFSIETIKRPTPAVIAIGNAFPNPLQAIGNPPSPDPANALFVIPSAQKLACVVGAGIGNPGDTFVVQIGALRRMRNQKVAAQGAENPFAWVEDPLAQFRFTIGANVGFVGGVLTTDEIWCKDVQIVNDWTNGRIFRKPAVGIDGVLAIAGCDLSGAPYFTVRATTAGEASAAGGWCPLIMELSR